MTLHYPDRWAGNRRWRRRMSTAGTASAYHWPIMNLASVTRRAGRRGLDEMRPWARRQRYRGSAVECPCCGRSWTMMLPHRGRQGARCPGCGSLERHRILWLYLQRETTVLRQGGSMLHFAPEEAVGRALRRIANVDYLSVDIEPGKAMRVMDITALSLADESFDVVLCNHVLEHVPDDHAAMSEIARVLRPTGRAIMQHPIDYGRSVTYENWDVVTPEARLREFGQEDHVRVYGTDFPDRLTRAGLDVTCRRYIEEIDPAQRARYSLSDGDDAGAMRGADIYECVTNARA